MNRNLEVPIYSIPVNINIIPYGENRKNQFLDFFVT